MTSKWVSALSDSTLGINTFSNCVGLADLQADGDYKLIIGNTGTGRYNVKLKVFKGLTLTGESVLPDIPSAVVPFINELTRPALPSIAISTGPSVLIYKNLKPFYKFNIPFLEKNTIESEAWHHAQAGQIDSVQLHAVLEKLREQVGPGELTSESQAFLKARSAERNSLVARCNIEKMARQSVITCMTTLKKSSLEESSIDCIVIGTESGDIYCIDSQAFTVLAHSRIIGSSVFINATGLYDVDYRVFVSNRDAEIFIVKRDINIVEKPAIRLKADIIDMTRIGKQLVVATNDSTLSFYTLKGKILGKLKMDQSIQGIDAFTYTTKQYVALLVALQTEVRIYQEMSLMDRLKIDLPISWIRCGKFGREEGVLIIGNKNGGITVKLFRRMAKLEDMNAQLGPPVAQNRKLNIPRRTKVFVDQTIREREQVQTMHQVFQRDLFMLRLTVTKAYANHLNCSLNSIATTKNESVDISVDVNGFGPIFRMTVKLRSVCAKPLENLWLTTHYNTELYSIDDFLMAIPSLVSGATYSFHITVECINPQNPVSDGIRVLLVSRSNVIVAAVVDMPISEMNILD